jgi:putative hydrolase of HD superfamily
MPMKNRPSIERVLELQQLLLLFSQIDRFIERKHQDAFRHESDIEHSYNLAMTAWFLAQYFPHINKDMVIKIALVHDMVEVYAGDTYIFADAKTIATKQDREAAALERLKNEWFDFPDMIRIIEAYETLSTEEAKFVYALDKIMPMMQVYINDGHTWKVEKMTLKMLNDYKKDKVKLSPEISKYYEELYLIVKNHPHFSVNP